MIKFDHEQEKVMDAIIGCDPEVVMEMANAMVGNPLEFFGKKSSEAAEYVYTISDPSTLAALTDVLLAGINAWRTIALLEQQSGKGIEEITKGILGSD